MKFSLAVVVLMMVLTGQAGAPTGSDEFAWKIIEHNNKWNKFFRLYFGCPDKALKIEECQLKLGQLDYGAYFKARKSACKVFDLVEKEKVKKK